MEDKPEPAWIEEREILAIHGRLLSIHGGAEGLRDPGLLASALARPRHRAAYDPAADMADLAAALTAGIVRDHPFIDGNKRTGFLAGLLFLELDGLRFTAPEDEAATAMLALAAGDLDEAAYANFLRRNLAP